MPAEKIHLEHVVPLSRGGEHSARNVRVSCRPCNSAKGSRLLTELARLPALPHPIVPTLAATFGVRLPRSEHAALLHEVWRCSQTVKESAQRVTKTRIARDEALQGAAEAGISVHAIARMTKLSRQGVQKILGDRPAA